MANTIDLTRDDDDDSRPIRLDSDEEDEDLKVAIALSLQEQENVTREVTRRHDEGASIANESMKEVADAKSRLPEVKENISKISQGLMSLDRKQMEQERLARLKRKRDQDLETIPRAISPPPVLRTASKKTKNQEKVKEVSNSSTLRQPTSSLTDFPYNHGKVLLTSQPSRRHTLSDNQQTLTSISFHDLIKPTRSDAILQSVFLSTFTVDFDWLLPHFDTRNVSFVLALHSSSQEHRILLQRDFEGVPNVKLVLPMNGSSSSNAFGCMHSKTMLLFYGSTKEVTNDSTNGRARCRIIIPCANLMPFDYGVGRVMENAVFVIDLPLASGEHSCVSQTGFKAKLVEQLLALGSPPGVIRKLDAFDFSNTQNIGFVHSIKGSHISSNPSTTPSRAKEQTQSTVHKFFSAASENGDTKSRKEPGLPTDLKTTSTLPSEISGCRTGLLSLCDAIKELGLDVSIPYRFGIGRGPGSESQMSCPITIDYITSSLGSLSRTFLHSLYIAACGREPAPDELLSSRTIASKAKLKCSPSPPSESSASDQTYELLKQHLRIYFPSDETVRSSRGGLNSAGTICFSSKWWSSTQQNGSNVMNTDFPHECLRDCIGVRGDGILMHSKIVYVRYRVPQLVKQFDGSQKLYVGWAYVGSANLGESAWGKITFDSEAKKTKIMCRNWESGVVIPLPLDKVSHRFRSSNGDDKTIDPNSMTLEEVFGDVVPVPIVYPSVSLVESNRQPWFFDG